MGVQLSTGVFICLSRYRASGSQLKSAKSSSICFGIFPNCFTLHLVGIVTGFVVNFLLVVGFCPGSSRVHEYTLLFLDQCFCIYIGVGTLLLYLFKFVLIMFRCTGGGGAFALSLAFLCSVWMHCKLSTMVPTLLSLCVLIKCLLMLSFCIVVYTRSRITQTRLYQIFAYFEGHLPHQKSLH